jgi:hypothetical protein
MIADDLARLLALNKERARQEEQSTDAVPKKPKGGKGRRGKAANPELPGL